MTPKLTGNINYAAQTVILSNPIPHPNAERLEGFVINGNRVWYGKDLLKVGDKVVYFPIECQINPTVLSNLNLFAEKTLNRNQEEKGYFDSKGRVRALRLRGEPSEGFILPISHLYNALVGEDIMNHPSKYPDPGDENNVFDTIDDTWICKKYVPTVARNSGIGESKKGRVKISDILVPDQFRFHYDTEKLQNNLHQIYPEDWIVITKKLHGTSAIFANLLTKVKYSWSEKLLKRLAHNGTLVGIGLLFFLSFVIASGCGELLFSIILLIEFISGQFYKPYFKWKARSLKIVNTEYADMYSSRSVLKRIEGKYHTKEQGYYNEDIWAHCYEAIKGNIEPGITLYGEIVGYLPGGKMVQKGYDYGFIQPTTLEFGDTTMTPYTYSVNYGLFIYRITYTTPNGSVLEYSWEQVKQYCNNHDLQTVPEIYSGGAYQFHGKYVNQPIDIPSEIYISEDFGQLTLNLLRNVLLEKDCDMCQNKVPAEGICVRRETRGIKTFKLKSFRFLEKESKDLDAGEVDVETEEKI